MRARFECIAHMKVRTAELHPAYEALTPSRLPDCCHLKGQSHACPSPGFHGAEKEHDEARAVCGDAWGGSQVHMEGGGAIGDRGRAVCACGRGRRGRGRAARWGTGGSHDGCAGGGCRLRRAVRLHEHLGQGVQTPGP